MKTLETSGIALDVEPTPHRAKPYTWRDWLADHKGQYPLYIQLGYWYELERWPVPGRIFQWHGWIPDLWYYVKCRLWRRYHTVTARTLSPTWSDAVHRLLHINFAILESVIVDERIFERTAADGNPTDGQSWAWALAEMRDLWDWWTVRRPARDAEYERRLHLSCGLRDRDRVAYKAFCPGWDDSPFSSFPPDYSHPADTAAANAALKELSDEITTAEDDAMLMRLMKLRSYLWT
jgi:hypothetical protein